VAFPYIYETNFETGDESEWTGTGSDANGVLAVEHYSELFRRPGLAMPFRGAYCLRTNLVGAASTQYVAEDTGFDITAGNEIFVAFNLFISSDLVMATTNEFNVMQLNDTAEFAVGINFTTANGVRIGVGETGPASATLTPFTLGQWHTVETQFHLDAGGGDDGLINWWFDGTAMTGVTGLDQAAITLGRVGAIGVDAGTTAGNILVDRVIVDDARIHPAPRFPETIEITKTGHIFVGPGTIDAATLLSGAGTDCVLQIYDTDEAEIEEWKTKTLLKNTANNEVVDSAHMPVNINRGAYCVLSGSNPRALVKTATLSAYASDGAIRTYAQNRVPRIG